MIEGGITVKKLSVLGIIFGIILGSFLGVTICVGFSATAAFARGGIGSHPSSIGAGGASGKRVGATTSDGRSFDAIRHRERRRRESQESRLSGAQESPKNDVRTPATEK
jgi:hypothetical protein